MNIKKQRRKEFEVLKIWEKQGEQFFSFHNEPHTVHYGRKRSRTGEEEGIIYIGPTHQFEAPKGHPFLGDEAKARIAREAREIERLA